MRHLVVLIALSFIVLASCACALALDPWLDINQYAHTSWKIRDGFAKGSIVSIAQTPDGYLWFGTEFGVLRFDGIRAVPWEPPRNQHVPPGLVMSLIVSRDGTLWIGATGLASYRNGQITQYPELAGKFIRSLLQDREGTIWVGAGDPGQLCSIRDRITHCYGHEASLGRFVASIYEDHKGNLWVGADNGLWRWKPGPPKFYPLAFEPDGVAAISEGADAELLIGWRNEIYRFANGTTVPYLQAGTPHVHRMLRDREGGIWIATVDRGLVHLHQGSTDRFSSADGLTGNVVYSLFEDRENNIWVSTIDGLDRFRDFAVTTLTVKQGLSSALVGSVLADRDGSVWLGTYGGLNRWHMGQITVPQMRASTRENQFSGPHPNSLFQDDHGRVWVSTREGLAYWQNGRLIPVGGIPGGNMLAITEDAEGQVWVINDQSGLLSISPKSDVQLIQWSALGHADHASVLAADRRQGGALWIGFFSGGIANFSHGQVRYSYTTANGLGAGRVSDFHLDHDGVLWISTQGGLSRLKNNRLATLTTKNGLPCDTVHWAIEDDDHSFWLYTACGLVRIARSELDAWSAVADRQNDPNRTIQVTVFDSSDGVRSLADPGYYHPQVAKTPDGKMWFLPWDGVSVIDPHHLPINNLPPPVHIEQITADGKIYGPGQGLPARVQHIDIDYTALSLVAPEKNRFRFKLEGYDRDWRDVGNRRQASYTNIPPRNYRFRVMACNNSGVWNEAGASLDFSILPAFYQTNWFRVLCGIAFLALILGLYQLRVQKMKKEFDIALEKARLYAGLKTRDAKIQRLVEANIIGIYIIDLGGQILEANDAFLRMVGYKREDLLSGRMSWTDLTPPEWRAADAQRLETIKKTGSLQPFEKEYFRKDGTRVPVLVGVARFEEEENQAVVFALDLSGQKRVEGALRSSEADLHEAQRLTHTGSWKLDLASGRVIISPEIYRIFDAKPDEDVSNPEFWFGRIHPEDRERVRRHFEKCVAEKLDYEADYRIVLPDTTIRYQHAIGRPVLSASGGLLEFLGTAMDVTEQVLARLELETAFEEIKQLRDQLSEENVALREEVDEAARVNERTRIARELHDTLLQNFHGLMFQFQAVRNLMTRRPEEAVRSLDEAINETKKALAESREAIQDLRSVPIGNGNLAELLTATSRELADSKSNEHPPVFDLIEEGERQALSATVGNDICRIAMELVRNAYQHAQAQRIEAEIRYGDSVFRLRIRDDGKGIDPKVLKEGGRSGHWGLRGVRERADRIGANLDLWSEAGGGTEAQLLVPAEIAYESLRDTYGGKLIRKVKSRA